MGSNEDAGILRPANKYEKETRIIWRSEIHFADYNPRFIDKEAQKRLAKNIEAVGFLGGIVWNEKTKNLVAGHQRVKDLDKKHKGNDYQVTVVVVNLEPNQEKEQNLFMNNPGAQGVFDFGKLGDVLQSGIDATAAGFDPAEVHKLFGNSLSSDSLEEIKAMADHIRELDETVNKVREGNEDKNNPDFYLVVVFRSYKERKEFTDEFGLEDNMYVSGEKIRDLICPEEVEE